MPDRKPVVRMHIFTYGSLMFPEVWTRVVRGRYRSRPARLPDHVRFAVRSASYPGIVPRPDACVDGVLYLDVESADLALLDRFEGPEYDRRPVAVSCGEGNRIEAETYVYRDGANLTGTGWDPARFDLAGFLRQHCR